MELTENNMKLYQYTLLKQDGTQEKLPPCKKKTLHELYALLDCSLVEVIPTIYYAGLGFGRVTMWGDEEARLNPANQRNQHFKVITDAFGEDWDVVGDIVMEAVYHGK